MTFKTYIAEEKERRPRKGDTVYTLGVWTYGEEGGSSAQPKKEWRNPVIYTRKLVVQAWGKKQAHFTDPRTGEFVKWRGYTEYFPWAFSLEGLTDLLEKTKQDIRRHQQSSFNITKNWLKEYNPEGGTKTPSPGAYQRAQAKAMEEEKWLTFPIDVKDYSEITTR